MTDEDRALMERFDRLIRERFGTQAEFARRLGVDAPYVSMMRRNPSRIRGRLADIGALDEGIDLNWLLRGSEAGKSAEELRSLCEDILQRLR